MTESNHLDVNIDHIMQTVRSEVAKRKQQAQATNAQTPRPEFSSVRVSSPAVPANLSISHIESLLSNAELRSRVRTKLPEKFYRLPFAAKLESLVLKVFNLIFRDQREVNFNLVRALQESTALNRQLLEQIAALRAQMDARLGAVDARLGAADARLGAVDARLGAVDARLGAVDTRLQEMNAGINSANAQAAAQVQGLNEQLSSLSGRVQGLDDRYMRNDTYLKHDLTQQKRLITLFLEDVRQRLPEPLSQETLQRFTDQDQHWLDAFYVAFEDRFRGSREEIKARLQHYNPLVEKAIAAAQTPAVLDIGCGRGEWLELLAANGASPTGIDTNQVMVQQCNDLNLKAIAADGLEYLRSAEDSSLAVVTAFHVIEHLTLQQFISLIDESLRVLRPGGIVIFETPNPENLIVGACNFYLDPTHRNPIPPGTAQLILENRGFQQVEIQRLHPMTEDHNLDNLFLKNLLLGCQDYAVIGCKP